MNKLDIINAINDYSLNDDKRIIDILNELFYSKEYKRYLDITIDAISVTQLYGFIAYMDVEDKNRFIDWDFFRSSTYSGKRMPFYNSGQLSLLYDINKYNKIFLSAPTSFGKTALVLENIIEEHNNLRNVLFIVPTNSLLEELYIKVIRANKDYELDYNVSTQPYFYHDKNNFIVLTPERLLILCEEVDLNVFDLIVMDETYKIVDSKNEAISDFVETRAVRFRKVADMIGKDAQKLILLSPFTYTLTQSMSNYLNKYDIKKIDRKLEYVKRNVYLVNNTSSFQNHFGYRIVGYQKGTKIPQKVSFLLRELRYQKNIVYVSQYNKAYEIVNAINWSYDNNYNQRYLDFIKHLENNYTINDQCEWDVISALKKRIGIYIAPIPRYIKKEIINLYNEGILQTLIVTTAFTEGVNTDACNLIFTSLSNGSPGNKLTDIDVLNAAGRAGRFAEKSVGNIYCITEEIYQRVSELQQSAEIKLENYNYCLSSGRKRIDYEIDMMEDEYLTDEEKNEKQIEKNEMAELGLSYNDLRLSLNVSTKWKLCLYNFFMNHRESIAEWVEAAENVLSSQSSARISSLNTVFSVLKRSFDSREIVGFPCEPYEIKPFDKSNNFTWGRLYRVYCSGNIAQVISNNIKYITSQFSSVINKYNLSNRSHKKFVNYYFELENLSWVLRYYHFDLSINYNAFYSETFKFISNIIQYKIPFYTSYFVSILKLFIRKNNLCNDFDISKLDVKKITLLFEDGSVFDDYSKMFDYGLPNDLIVKLNDHEISIENLKNKEYSDDLFDNYEKLIMEEFLSIF